MNIMFMGTPDFAIPSLEALYEAGHNVTCVITQPDKPKGRGHKMAHPPVYDFAENHGTPVYQPENLKKENFILYLTSDVYCDFEAVIQEAMDELNPEILDAVIDITETQDDGDIVTEKYWETQRELLKKFLMQLYEEVISHW